MGIGAGEDRSPARPRATDRGLWGDSLGRAGARCGQVLLIAAVITGVVWVLLQVAVVVIAVMVALILACAVHPAVRWLVRRGLPRMLATVTAFVAILVILSGVITGIVLAVRSQWDELSASAVDGWHRLQDFLMNGPLPIDTDSIDTALSKLTGLAGSGAFLGSALSGIGAATGFVTGAALVVVLLFFFLKDGPRMWSFGLRWFRGDTRAKLAESGDRTVQVLGGYVRGTAIIAAVDAVCIGIPLALLGVPLALPLAVIVFMGGFLPIVGATVAGTLAALVALVTNGLVVALVVVAIIIVVQQLEGDLLQPVVMGRTLRLHAIVVLLALAIGAIVGGIFGALLAVPFTAVGWSVVQVWTDAYQAGPDPVLGEDPLSPGSQAASRASISQRIKYRRMRTQGGRDPRATPAGRSGADSPDPDGRNPDGRLPDGQSPDGPDGDPPGHPDE
ncbi:AI-2E family transporter [Pseudactinotalea sp. HY160]|uniref:AI-2E family transporter n=1 Tax=Pseudactinotalea sp. HY160 TaxID=2654490 RepID=UPI00128DF0D4|nr:AI-2E family transporter [Pseudactinotalea sp. HY160]MPV51398.1 AI-2E family transporter [Pseudactinotalea sp. HY160]